LKNENKEINGNFNEISQKNEEFKNLIEKINKEFNQKIEEKEKILFLKK